jgi:hypothetical protein
LVTSLRIGLDGLSYGYSFISGILFANLLCRLCRCYTRGILIPDYSHFDTWLGLRDDVE